jgi:hypothetical protein
LTRAPASPIIAVVRWLAGGGAVALAAFLCAGAGTAAGGRTRVTCGGGGSTTLLFWPHGHGAIPRVDFPAYRPPHVEVYKTGPRYLDQDFRAFAGPGAGSWGPQCTPTSGPAAPTRVRRPRTLTKQAVVLCRLKSPAVSLERTDTTGASTLKVFVGTRVYVSAVVRGKAGSSVTYDAGLCTTKAAP